MFFNGKKGSFYLINEWVMYIFIALYPFVLYSGYLYYGTTTRSINLVLISGLMAVVFGVGLLQKKNTVTLIKSPVMFSLIAFFVVIVISGLFGVDFHTTFWSKATRMTGVFYFLHLGMFMFFLSALFKEKEKMIRFLNIFVVSSALFSLGSLLGRDGFNIIFTQKPWDGFTFGNSSFAAMYIYAGFMTSLYLLFRNAKDLRKWWHYVLPVVIFLNPYILSKDFLTGKVNILSNPSSVIGEAQASSVVFFVSIVFLFVLWLVFRIKKSKIRKNVLIGGIVVGSFACVYSLYSFLTPGGMIQEMYLKEASPARPIVWELSKYSIKEKPILGWGSDNFDKAFESHYDNSLLEKKNGNEAWFDRAHNIIIDQTVETGYVGTIFYIIVFISLIYSVLYVLIKSEQKEDRVLASVLLVYFVGHFMELQTAFDTTISYVSLAVMFILSVTLYSKVRNDNKKNDSIIIGDTAQQFVGCVVVLLFLGLMFIGTFQIIGAQNANNTIRKIGSAEKRIPYYDSLLGSPVDLGAVLWRTSTDFQRGISQNPKVLENPKTVESLIKELGVIVESYEKFSMKSPNSYRVQINLASTYMYQRLFEIDNLDKAHDVLDRAITLAPKAPQAYWMKSVAYLYQRKFDLAREWAKKAHDLNPEIEQSQNVVRYIDQSIKTFPEIDLFMFWQS